MAAPSITAQEARETALNLVDQARTGALDSPRRLSLLVEAQVFATLSLAPETPAQDAPKPVRKRAAKPAPVEEEVAE